MPTAVVAIVGPRLPPPRLRAAVAAIDTSYEKVAAYTVRKICSVSHEPVMNDVCCPLLARKGKCFLEYFDILRMSHGNSLFCIIKSPFQIETITNR